MLFVGIEPSRSKRRIASPNACRAVANTLESRVRMQDASGDFYKGRVPTTSEAQLWLAASYTLRRL